MKRLVAVALLALCGAAEAAPNKNTKDQLQRFVDRVEALHANFEQVQKDDKGNVTQTSTGSLWIARPGRFRWEYQKPYVQLITCDGKTLWMYDPDLKQVTVRPAAESLQGTPAQLLAGRAALEKQFKIQDAGAEGVTRRLKLTPLAADSDFSSVELWMTDGVPQRMAFTSTIGGSTEVTFSQISLNQKQADGFFAFTVPPGTEVIQAPEAEAPAK